MITSPPGPAVSDASEASPATDPAARRVPDWEGIWDDCPEIDGFAESIEGKIPEGLVGSLYRNGPGKRSLGKYFFDGDGQIRRVRITPDGRVHYRSRYVQTPKYLAEIGADRPRVRSAGTQLPGGMLANFMKLPASEANTHVIEHEGKLLALHEGGAPFAMDPETLDTLGVERFSEQLRPGVPFSAHPHRDPETGETFNFGVVPGQKTKVAIYKFTASGAFAPVTRVPIPRFTFLHDFALSQNWLAFPIPDVGTSLLNMMSGRQSVFEALHEIPEPPEWLLVSRDGKQTRRYEMERLFFPGHIIAAREVGHELIIDLCSAGTWKSLMDELSTFREAGFNYMAKQQNRRVRFDLRSDRMTVENLGELPGDFPRPDERLGLHQVRYSYLSSNPVPGMRGLFRGISKLDLNDGSETVHDLGVGNAASEPVFVPDPARDAEDGGWVLTMAHNGARRASDLVILDAQHIEDGPVATAHLPANGGYTFHGSWVGE